MLQRVESTLFAIRNKLYNNEDIRKLLFHDSNNALNMLAPSKEEVSEYITVKPIFEFENKEGYEQNSIINIYPIQVDPIDDRQGIEGVIQINVVCNTDQWELIDNKIRPLQLANKIIKLINNNKFTVSNKLTLNTMTELILSKKMTGFALLFDVVDGSGENEQF